MIEKVDWSDVFYIKLVKTDSFYGRVERHGFVHHDQGGYYADEVITEYDPFPDGTNVRGSCIIPHPRGLDVKIYFERNDEDGLIATDWEVV